MAAATYPVGTIAKLLLLTDRRVQQLTAQGVLPKAERGRYELAPVVQAYVRYLRERAVGGDLGGGDEIGEHKTRLIKARARAAEAEADQIEGRLLKAAEVETAWQALVGAVRARMLSLPMRMAATLHGQETLQERAAALTAVVHEALAELAETPVYGTADPGGAEGGGRRGARAADPEAAAEADRQRVGRSEPDLEPGSERGAWEVDDLEG